MCLAAVGLHALVHSPEQFGATGATLLLLATTLLVSLPLSWASFKLIEEPANALGKRLASSMRTGAQAGLA